MITLKWLNQKWNPETWSADYWKDKKFLDESGLQKPGGGKSSSDLLVNDQLTDKKHTANRQLSTHQAVNNHADKPAQNGWLSSLQTWASISSFYIFIFSLLYFCISSFFYGMVLSIYLLFF